MAGSPSQRPSVLVFATGGTIGMRSTGAGLAPDPDFPDVLDDLVSGICSPLGVDWRINHLHPPIDSANADTDTAPRIARAIRARVRTQRPRGVVVTHGTDTLAYTAARLAFDLADLGAPVVVTGSQLPHGAADSDVAANLSLALRASLRASREAPVCVAFGGSLIPAVRATKHDSDALAAFRAEAALAPDARGVQAVRSGSGADGAAQPDNARIVSFRFVPGVIAEDLLAAASVRPDGLVLECYGSGNGPVDRPGMREALRKVASAMPVVAVSQCATGGVDFARYATGKALAATGVIDGSDLTVEAATAKLGYLLDAGHRWDAQGEDAFRALMEANLVGESR